jgi:glycosyltransferase involved in cell wall biosynthesis
MEMINKFIIFIPIYNFELFLEECIESLLSQKHTNWICLLYDDGSTDGSYEICKNYKRAYPDKFVIRRNVKNEGPASTKYSFLKLLGGMSDPNDVAVILDGDDSLIGDYSLGIIDRTYTKSKCWMTYGSFEGMWEEQTKGLPEEERIDFRKISWRYGHPRSFKCFFSKNFNAEDFKYSDSSWLKKGTDRPLIFNLLEWCQKGKVGYIKSQIYKYRTHDKNTWKVVDGKTSWRQKEYVNNKSIKEKYEEEIHIVMCSWKRVKNLRKIITMLKEQSISKRVHFHIVNNNEDEKENIEDIIRDEKELKISVKHYKNEYYGFQRFMYIRDELLKKYLIDYVIIIDDDLSFHNKWVEEMYIKRETNSYIGFYGKRFNPIDPDYWKMGWHTSCRKNMCRNLIKMDYIATCGCIIDCSIFYPNSILWDIPKDIPEGVCVYNIEDIWLSYISNKLGWNNKRSFNPMEVIEEEDPKIAQFFQLKESKYVFLKYLINEKDWVIQNKKSNIHPES